MLQKIFLIEVWLIPTTRKPGVLQSLGLQAVRHDLATEQQQLICNVVLISAVSSSDSVIHIYVCTFFFKYSFPLWFIIGC